MKSFIVFAAVIAVATASAVRSSGWGAPPSPSIDLELAAAAAAAGAGSAAANQALLEQASSVNGPASISSSNGVLAEVSQGEDISQVAVANIPSGATSTINAVDVSNEAVALDVLNAALLGDTLAAVTNAANTDANGQGAIAAEASSLNNVQSRQ